MSDKQAVEISGELKLEFDGKTCIKCHYKRQPTDNAPEWACPSCGVAYVKAEAAIQEEQAQLGLQNRIERVKFIEENEKLDPKEQASVKADKLIAKQIYILIFFGGITGGITFLIGMAMAFKHHNFLGKQNWAHSHFAWQVKAFWDATLWAGVGFLVVLAGFIASIKNSFKDGLGSGYEVYGQLFGWLFDPFFIKCLAVGGVVIVMAGVWHLVRMIQGYRALQRDEPI
jgi:uncharacterized membrane protein/predicted RNA-binding Zn-ribbon protein involved in translation (DUF1610 family)